MTRRLLKLLFLLVLLLFGACDSRERTDLISSSSPDQFLKNSYINKTSNFFVETEGIVIKLLSDDNEGSRHQRFIIRLSTGQTLLIVHNIDIAPRINGLAVGNSVQFMGEYLYNDKGGIIHWTHHDPAMKKQGGWIKYRGITYN